MNDFAMRMLAMRKAYPTQVICAFQYPDGLEVFMPMSAELIEADPREGRRVYRRPKGPS